MSVVEYRRGYESVDRESSVLDMPMRVMLAEKVTTWSTIRQMCQSATTFFPTLLLVAAVSVAFWRLLLWPISIF